MLRLFVSVFFPSFQYSRHFDSTGELGNLTRISSALSSIALNSRTLPERRAEYILSERVFFPYALIIFGRVSIRTTVEGSDKFSVQMTLTTQRLLVALFSALVYIAILYGYFYRGTSAKTGAQIAGILLIVVNCQSRIFAGWYHWDRLKKLVDSNDGGGSDDSGD
jgi:hypothetical protein